VPTPAGEGATDPDWIWSFGLGRFMAKGSGLLRFARNDENFITVIASEAKQPS
jgi:hypothetical protein